MALACTLTYEVPCGYPRTPVVGHAMPRLAGRTDDFASEADREWARAHVGDVRILDTDHFILWRHPDVVADVIQEALAAAQDN